MPGPLFQPDDFDSGAVTAFRAVAAWETGDQARADWLRR